MSQLLNDVQYEVDDDTGPDMFISTEVLRFRPSRVNLGALPISISWLSMIASLVGLFLGLIAALVLYHWIWHWPGLLGMVGGGGLAVGYALSLVRPYQGESVGVWLWLSARPRSNVHTIAGRKYQVYLGCAPVLDSSAERYRWCFVQAPSAAPPKTRA